MKRAGVAIVALALGLVIGGLGRAAIVPGSGSQAIVPMKAILAVNYQSVAGLTRAAQLIVFARASFTEDVQYGQLPFAVTTLEVLDVLKSNRAAPGRLRVLELGGRLQPGPVKGGDGAMRESRTVSLEGVPVMKPGAEYVLFLEPYVGSVTSDAWVALGQFQGTFEIVRGEVTYGGDRRLLSEAEFATQREFDAHSLTALRDEVHTNVP